MLDGQATPRTHLCLVSVGQGDVKSCRDQLPFKRFDLYRFREVGTDIHARRLRCGISRQRVMRFIDNLYFHSIFLL